MAGPEFEELQGHVLVMYKALYDTRSGGACWHDKLFNILQQIDFKPSKADPDIWMRSSKHGAHYEYIAVYVDDLAICIRDPKALCDTLMEVYKLKLKDMGPLIYHLGCRYTRHEDGTLVEDQESRGLIFKHISAIEKPQTGYVPCRTYNRKCTKTLSNAPCLVVLRMYLTLHLLLFGQSM